MAKLLLDHATRDYKGIELLMSERFQMPVPFWRLQFHLLGGLRRMGMVAFAYSAVLVFGVFAWQRAFSTDPFSKIAGTMANGLAGIQCIVLYVGGANAVYRATLRDFQTRMIESHRLSPMSKFTVVLGYLFGAPLQVLLLFTINLIIGAFITGIGRYSVVDWLLGNVCLINGALTLWAVAVFGGVGLNKPISPVAIMLGVGMLTFPVLMLPAAGLMTGAYSSYAGFGLITGSMKSDRTEVLVLFALQLVLTTFWLWAAARKYRRPDLPALNALGGYILLTLWLVLGVIGIMLFEQVVMRRPGLVPDSTLLAQWVATMIGGLIIATLMVSGSVESRMIVRLGRLARGRLDEVSDFAVSISAAFFICLVMASLGYKVWNNQSIFTSVFGPESRGLISSPWLYSLLSCLLALLTVRGAMAFALTREKPAKRTAWLFIVLLWVGPAMIDGVRMVTLEIADSKSSPSGIMAFSPLGTLIMSWRPSAGSQIWPGSIFQVFVAMIVTFVAMRAEKARVARECGQKELSTV